MLRSPIMYDLNNRILLAAVTSWFQSISGVAAIVLIFNALCLKRLIASQIYRSKVLFKRLAFVKLYLFNILDIVGLGSLINRRFNCFKVEAVVSEKIDRTLSLERMFRMLDQYKQKEVEQNLQEKNQNNQEDLKQIKKNYISKFEKNLMNQSRVDLALPSKPTNSKSNPDLLPQQQDSFPNKLLQKFNMNVIQVNLSSQKQDISSKLSVLLAVIGIVLVCVLLHYLGAFAPNELRESNYTIKETNSIQMGTEHTPIYPILHNQLKQQVFINPVNDTIFFAKMDKNYKIVEKYIPKKNCSVKDGDGMDVIYNYCLDDIVLLESNEVLTERLVVLVTEFYTFDLIVKQKTVEVFYDYISITLKENKFSLFSALNLQASIRRTNYKSGDSNSFTVYEYLINPELVVGMCGKDEICVVFTLIRQQYALQLLEDSSYYIFQNVWSTSYFLFSSLIIFVIMPYNSRQNRNNMLSKIIRMGRKLMESIEVAQLKKIQRSLKFRISYRLWKRRQKLTICRM